MNEGGVQIPKKGLGRVQTAYFKWIIDGKDTIDEYGKNLALNMPLSFGGHMIWPSPHVTPQELGTIGTDADDPIEYVANIQKELSNT